MLRIRQSEDFKPGYNAITTMDEAVDDTRMNFGILRLVKEQQESSCEPLERAFLLIYGSVRLHWDGQETEVSRKSCFDENPVVLHVPAGMNVTITGLAENTELCVTATDNDRAFAPKLYSQQECASELRGRGTMNETSTRIVRTVFDYSNASYSNLVVGEVIDYPGRWSSYPPHHHPQPEIYFYKFLPEQGYGFCELGEDALKLRHNDTVKILSGATHPQTTAPGYAMYYIWVIRHIDGNPYITPTFVPEHLWVTDPNAKIWPDK